MVADDGGTNYHQHVLVDGMTALRRCDGDGDADSVMITAARQQHDNGLANVLTFLLVYPTMTISNKSCTSLVEWELV